MVTRHDVIIRGWSSNFRVQIHVFQLHLTIEVKLVDEMTQSACLCYFTCQAQKNPFIAVLTGCLILGKIQDGDHC